MLRLLTVGLVLAGGVELAAAQDACAAPALGFIAGSELHLTRALGVIEHRSNRISIDPYAAPPEDAFVPFEGHPEWGRTAVAAIVTATETDPEYSPIRAKAWWQSSCEERPCACDEDQIERQLRYSYQQRSYEETLCCDSYEHDDDSCSVASSSGDAEIVPVPALIVPALRNYFVLYLEKTAPAGSEFAEYLFGSKDEVSAGYHLVRGEALGGEGPEYAFTILDIDRPIRADFELGATPTGLNI